MTPELSLTSVLSKSSTIDLVSGYLLRSGLHDEFVTVVPLQITQKCQSCHKLLTTQRHRLLTNLETKSISNAKVDIGKFLSSNKDILDKPFLVYWICVDDSQPLDQYNRYQFIPV